MNLRIGALGLAAVLLPPSVAPAPAVASSPSLEIGVIGGLLFPDDEITGHGPDADDFGYPLGLQLVRPLHDNWAVFADGHFTSLESARPSGDASLWTLRAGVRALLPGGEERIGFFANAGAGYLNVDADDRDGVGRAFLSAGFGQRFRLGDRVTAHWEARADASLGDEGEEFLEGSVVNRQFLVGLSLGLGGAEAPRDTDGDGVVDRRDECPDTPRGAHVDDVGCPEDSDGDGVWDGLDECPDTPRGWPVDRKGCPEDSDRDGVPDGADDCPDTPRGTEVDENGCPKVAPLFVPDEKGEVKPLVLEGVNFEYDSAQLTPGSRTILDRVAESLVAWPDVAVEVGGHTDSRGPDEYNRKLSQRRAEAVKSYLAGKGVDAGRLTTKGYGETQPVASNDTDEGRARNRRVELRKTS